MAKPTRGSEFVQWIDTSALLSPEADPTINNHINTATTETYGSPTAPLGFRLGNGGAGYTGILKALCDAFIFHKSQSGTAKPFRVEWVANHSRHTQLALLGDAVQIALTYEPDWEDQATAEGWAKRIGRAFNDRFVLAGPDTDPARVAETVCRPGNDDLRICLAFREIARFGGKSGKVVLHHRGDGSATSVKEMQLWGMSGVDLSTSLPWRSRISLPPHGALVEAAKAGVYVLTDRATYLSAERAGVIPGMKVFVEEGRYLLNPCSILVNTKVERNECAWEFAEWLTGAQAQVIVRHFGKDKSTGLPVFTDGKSEEVYSGWSLVKAKL
ncbi:hypothetical protein LTR62_002491 [Meristemomyces frigidus]|uniref:PBP domain-containing protein n=1 Tax=Meristemomyces frigidus TaxID=1508187 RepID=A0AAN7TF73_9PEZI|nr:hypothetical protein LTR62_002491 [Meristemomyces frigidus]